MIASWSLLLGMAWAQCVEETEPALWYADPEAQDTKPPSRPLIDDVDLELVPNDGCASCPDTVRLTLTFSPSTDDQTPSDLLGYTVTLLEGEAPESVPLPDAPFLPDDDGTAVWVWHVDRRDFADPLIAILELRTIDLAGNTSSGRVEVDIRQPGLGVLACTMPPTLPTAPLALFGLVAMRRRRR